MKKVLTNIVLILIVLLSAVILLSARGNPVGLRSFVVESGSMTPTYPVGGVVFTLPEVVYQKGAVISFTLAGMTVTHRIYKIENENGADKFVTKGDANNTPDETPIQHSNIIGKVVFFVPYLGYFVNFLKTLPGLIIFILLPVFIFIVIEIRTIKNEILREFDKRVSEKVEKERLAKE